MKASLIAHFFWDVVWCLHATALLLITYLPVCCRVELGRALAKMGQKEAALQELEQAVTMEEEDINAHLQKVCRLRGRLS